MTPCPPAQNTNGSRLKPVRAGGEPGPAPRSGTGGNRLRCAGGGLLLTLAALVAGCGTDRFLTIHSEPAGALVHLNDQEVGRTPLTVPFTYYGVYDIRLSRENAQPLWTSRRAHAPSWEFPPLDLASEFVGADVGLLWRFELSAAPETGDISTDALLEAARNLRQRTEAGN